MKITNVNDYVDEVCKKFPELTKEDVKRILVYGWKLIVLCKLSGNDVSILTPKLFFFIGTIPKNSLLMFKTYCKKLAKRILYMFKKSRAKWDGYYYFTRSENLYKDYLKLSNKKYKTFKDVFLYKLYEEVRVNDASNPYIFRLSEDKTSRMSKYYPIIKTDKAELVTVRDSMNINDLMTSYNKYKYIQ